MNEVDEVAGLPGRDGSARIEPDGGDWAVVGEEFTNPREGFASQVARKTAGGSELPGIADGVGLMPVLRLRVVETEAHAGSLAGGGAFLHNVAAEGGCVNDVEAAVGGAEHGEAVVVHGGDDHVCMPAVLAMPTHSAALHSTGLNREATVSYSATGICARRMSHSLMP